jgi:hypothetical protein
MPQRDAAQALGIGTLTGKAAIEFCDRALADAAPLFRAAGVPSSACPSHKLMQLSGTGDLRGAPDCRLRYREAPTVPRKPSDSRKVLVDYTAGDQQAHGSKKLMQRRVITNGGRSQRGRRSRIEGSMLAPEPG